MKKHRGAFLGVFFALLACAIWGVSFLAPRALVHQDPEAIACFRFLFFGLTAFFAALIRWRHFPRIGGRDFREGVLLAASGYSVYYVSLSLGIKKAGIPFATAIVGLLPLTILIMALPARALGRYRLPALLLLSGALLVPAELFSEEYGSLLARSMEERAIGLGAAFFALALWTFFAVRNARFLRARPEWHAMDWASVLGMISAVLSGLFFFLTHGREGFARGFADSEFLLWTAFMGIAGAWVATGLWNEASRRLSAAAVGQLLVFEAVFGLFYAFLYEGRAPRVLEALSITALLCGALLAMRKLSQTGSVAEPER
jgi:drug/metabolite transporter (DMT)-like permease